MNTTSKPRKPSDAACLSALLPGLGHLYCGNLQRGFLWMATSIALMIAAIAALMLSPTRTGFTLAITFLVIDLVVWCVSTVQAWRQAKRQSPDYTLREYNRWYVYAILFLLCGFGSAVGFAFVLHERVIQAFVIPSHSMEPTINSGDRILTLKEVFLDRDPERGELVVFRNPEHRRQHWIKRVIGLAGDEIEWHANGDISVNDVLIERTPSDEKDVFIERHDTRVYTIKITPSENGPPAGRLIVPPYHCFVLGDNRFLSKDSRTIGPIAYSGLVAAPVAKVWGGVGKLK